MLCEEINTTAHILLTMRDNLVRNKSPGTRAQAQEFKHESPGTRAQAQEPRHQSLGARGARCEELGAGWVAAGCFRCEVWIGWGVQLQVLFVGCGGVRGGG